jgi:hypothetical protein
LEVSAWTLGQVSNGVIAGQIFGTLRDKARAKQATFARADLTGVDVPLGASFGHFITPIVLLSEMFLPHTAAVKRV